MTDKLKAGGVEGRNLLTVAVERVPRSKYGDPD